MNKKILLIGGAGYIGTVLIRHLLDKKYHVTCLDNLIYNHFHSLSEFEKINKFDFVFGDLRDDFLINKRAGYRFCPRSGHDRIRFRKN